MRSRRGIGERADRRWEGLAAAGSGADVTRAEDGCALVVTVVVHGRSFEAEGMDEGARLGVVGYVVRWEEVGLRLLAAAQDDVDGGLQRQDAGRRAMTLAVYVESGSQASPASHRSSARPVRARRVPEAHPGCKPCCTPSLR